jgi:hypothetical protein
MTYALIAYALTVALWLLWTVTVVRRERALRDDG